MAYLRGSVTDAQSLAEQNEAFFDYCQREGLEAVEAFADEADADASAFRRLVAFLRACADARVVVVVQGIDGLGADLKEAARRYFQLEGLGAQVAPMAGPGDVRGELLSALCTQQSVTNVGDRVRTAMRRRAIKGEVLGRPPFGYKVGGRRRLELVPEEAVVVRYIFRLYINESIGIRLIARRLNQEGITTRRGGAWTMVAVRDILRNRTYLGTYSRFGVRVAGSHTALIGADEFRAVQDRLNSRRTSYSSRTTSQFLLSGLAYCGYCGNKLIALSRRQMWKRRNGDHGSNTYRYYQCESRTNQNGCGYRTRRAADLEADVRAALASLQTSDSVDQHVSEPAPRTRHSASEVARLRSRLRSIDREIDGYVAAAVRGAISEERMHSLAIAAAKKRLAVEDELEHLPALNSDAPSRSGQSVETINMAATLAGRWDEMTFSERYRGLRDALTRIVVTDESITLTLHK